MWGGNYKTWDLSQRYQNSVLEKAGSRLYRFRAALDEETGVGYEDAASFTEDEAQRLNRYHLLDSSYGIIDFEPTRKMLGKFKSIGWKFNPSGGFFLPDSSKVLTAYLSMGHDFSVLDYLFLTEEDAPHIGSATAFRIVEVVTEGLWMPGRMLVGITAVQDENLISYMDEVVKTTHFEEV